MRLLLPLAMTTILSVALFLIGIVLLLLGANAHALHRSKVPLELQGSARAKSVWLLVGALLFLATGLALFIAPAIASP